jgi:hypothetical protein
MNISSIGVQQILPQSGTGWRDANPAPERENDSGDASTPEPTPARSPPAPGSGQVVDRIA